MTARASGPLRGRGRVPGDKSVSHRAVMLASAAVGTSHIEGLLEAGDILATIAAMAAFGADIERLGEGRWRVRGVGPAGFMSPEGDIDFGNAGTGVRLASGLISTMPVTARFIGDASLSRRPMGRIIEPLEMMGARFETRPGGVLPMTVVGAERATPIRYRLPVASAQVKSAVLLAGLSAPGETSVIEPTPTRDHTERMLAGFGCDIAIGEDDGERVVTVAGDQVLKACDMAAPADPSSAAFAVVAATIVPGSALVIEDVMLNETRTGLLTTLEEMGADIRIENRRLSGGEEIGDIHVSHSELKGVEVPAQRAASMIDEYPVLAIAAAMARGTTRMTGIGELRVKESDRLAAIVTGLASNGVETRCGDDWLEIDGGGIAGGGTVKTDLDHRIAMAFLIAGLAAREPVSIDDGRAIETSFPGFADLMGSFGADITPAGTVT